MSEQIKITDQGTDHISIEIKPLKTAATLMYPTVLLLLWLLGIVMIRIKSMEAESPSMEYFFILLTAFWAICGIFLIYILLWKLFGKEIVEVNKGVMSLKKQLLFWKNVKTFNTNEISLLSPTGFQDREQSQSMNMAFFGIAGGAVSFVYNFNIYRFGIQLSKKDTNQLIETLKPYTSN